MRRIRNEQIHEFVNRHMKRRKYTEGEGWRRSQRLQSTEQLSLKDVVKCENSVDNAISYSSISGDATQCDQQFTRLKSFISEATEPYRSDLLPILYPVFVHVYLELICNGQKTPGHKFFSRHQNLFTKDVDHRNFLIFLSKLNTKDDVNGAKEVKYFRKQKSLIRLSEDTLEYLQRHLRSEDNVLMLQIFTQHIHLQVNGDQAAQLDLEENPEAQSSALASPPYTPENKVIHSEVSLSSLQHCIKQVRSRPPCLPSICFYSVTNAVNGLCTGCISQDQKLLAGAFEDSSIRVWSLTTNPLIANGSQVNISHIHMAGDYEDDIYEKSKPPGPSEMMTMRGHSGSIYGAQFSTDDRFLLSCSADTTVRLWDMDTFNNKVIYRGHNYPVWDLDISGLGHYFATCSHDKTAKIWSMECTYPLRSLVGHTFDVDCIKFHPNSKYLATGSSDKSVRLWSVEDGKSVRLLQGHRGGVFSLAFAPNGQYLASSGEDRKIKIWDLRQGQLLREFKGHTDAVHSLCFNTDNTLLASGGLDCHIRVWNITNLSKLDNIPDSSVSPELMGSYSTKMCTVPYLTFSRSSLLYGLGALTC